MENKICIYAICKNEEQFVDRWYESMKEADYIVVLDTGSTDGTLEKLKAHKDIIVEQKVITPWRFDVARNESLKLVPADANILFCTDLDETLDPGWSKPLREKWIEGQHERGFYKYIWSHDENGNPGRIFHYDKIHSRHWHWYAPVHEMLTADEPYASRYNSHAIDLFDDITLQHYPDNTKSRSSYLPLLELRAKENPTDYYGLYYLSHEYYYQGYYEKSISLLNDLYYNHNQKFSQLEQAAMFLFMGDCYYSMGQMQDALTCYNKSIEIDRTYREPYLAAAEIYNSQGLFYLAIGYTNEALKNSIRRFSWLERDNSWNEQPYDILSIAYYYLDEINKALDNVNKALEFNNKNTRILLNKEYIVKRKEEIG